MTAGSIVIDLLMKTGSFETDTKRGQKALRELKKEAQDAGKLIGASLAGVGIAADDMPKLFKAFTQLDGTATREKGGMGLGLSIAQRMAHAVGGSVTVTSERGVGSTFVVRMPLKALAAPAVRAAA